jgi:hypothetical protein
MTTKLTPAQLAALRIFAATDVSHVTLSYLGRDLAFAHRQHGQGTRVRGSTGQALLRAGLLERHRALSGGGYFYTVNDAGRALLAMGHDK